MPSIPRLSARDSTEELAEALEHAGCLVVTDAADRDTRDALCADLARHVEASPIATEDDPAEFYPAHTHRVTALVTRSATARELVQSPIALGLCDHFLAPNCERYQLHVTAALVVGPGARAQVLHREEDPYTFFPLPRPNLIVATMWAMSDFTADNGGTLLVPGSHRWSGERKATAAEVVSAEMPAGAVLVWLGGTLHGAGANRSDEWRYGVVLTYSLGWLRQEENQYLDVPAHVARGLSSELRALIGYKMHGALGFSDRTLPEGS